jgi:hypothetical protein
VKKISEPKQVQQAEWVKVNRSEIHVPDYNPRKIDGAAQKRLRRQIKEDSLVDTLVVNRRTMNVVGGSQRCSQLDALYNFRPGETDYSLNVQMIDVDERTEVKINMRLNNRDAQGEYDPQAVLQVMEEFNLDPLEDFNFEKMSIETMLAETGSPIGTGPSEIQASLIADIKDVRSYDGMREAKKAFRDKQKGLNDEGKSKNLENDDYIVTIVFNNNSEKHEFMKKIGRPRGEKFIKGALMREIMKPEYR